MALFFNFAPKRKENRAEKKRTLANLLSVTISATMLYLLFSRRKCFVLAKKTFIGTKF